jgi:hypothetical protein
MAAGSLERGGGGASGRLVLALHRVRSSSPSTRGCGSRLPSTASRPSPPPPRCAGAPPPQLHCVVTRPSSPPPHRAAPVLPLHGGRAVAAVMGERGRRWGRWRRGQWEHLGRERGEPTQHMQPTKHHEIDSNYAAHLLMQSTKHGVKWWDKPGLDCPWAYVSQTYSCAGCQTPPMMWCVVGL